MQKLDVKHILEGAGFTLEKEGNLGDSYHLPVDSKWKIIAYGSHEGSLLLGTIQRDVYEQVSFSLDNKGTNFECNSLAALQEHLNGIVDRLRHLAANEDLLKCPKCKTRHVHLKAPRPGDKWTPFLSCDGMDQRSGKMRVSACEGTSKKIDALVVYD